MLIKNLAKGVLKKVKNTFHNEYQKIGLSWTQTRMLKNAPENAFTKIPFLGHSVLFHNRLEFLHSIDEIYFKEIYKTKFDVPDPVILDCGANIGLSVIYFKTQCPSARITAFEPDAFNFDLLSKNLSSMQITDVELRKEAIWITNGDIEFSSDKSMSSKIGEIDNTTQSAKVSVKALRLKDFINAKIDFLKIDIEGAEYQVIRDIQEKLHFVERLFVEYHGKFEENHKLLEILDILDKNGFLFYITDVTNPHSSPFDIGNNQMPYDILLNISCFRHI